MVGFVKSCMLVGRVKHRQSVPNWTIFWRIFLIVGFFKWPRSPQWPCSFRGPMTQIESSYSERADIFALRLGFLLNPGFQFDNFFLSRRLGQRSYCMSLFLSALICRIRHRQERRQRRFAAKTRGLRSSVFAHFLPAISCFTTFVDSLAHIQPLLFFSYLCVILA